MTAATSSTFEKPSPGSWVLDRAHCQRARSTYIQDTQTIYTEGFRDGFRKYGALLDTLEQAHVNGIPYMCARPVGAPPESKGPPPKLLFKLLLRLHPELRRRTRRAVEVFATKAWREDVEDFHERFYPELKSKLLELQRVDLSALNDDALLQHLERARGLALGSFRHHFAFVPAYMVAVGDFLAHALAWTGASRREVLATLEGASPVSREGADLVAAVAEAVAGDRELRALVESGTDAGSILARLRDADGSVGKATAAWLDTVGNRIFTGFDLDALTAIEMPSALVACLRSALAGPMRVTDRQSVERRVAELRARVPAEHRGSFDELYAEACTVYGLRDAHSAGCEMWTMGLLRLALLEGGRRLVGSGRLAALAHVVDLRHDELVALLRGEGGPSAREVEARARDRAAVCVREAPDLLGPAPGAPPPADWLPPGAARMQRAFDAYLGGMFDEAPEPSADAAHVQASTEVRGLGASPGRHVGTARLVIDSRDFEKLQRGDILVAPITTPAYNVVLPLLGGVVTDRGGLLSHPAIVTREYGIPGVVGTREATRRIPDGARVEIDGDAGTVTVLP